ncbi:GNAT family N-acetyltransferase [Sorangium sp. So ce1036]|uniref:GNAT family N-acetyltransferase n=1 Tax=Sorangium sp. So ce1036 TaxID=3133328 RepID=UPI003F03D52B
MPEVSEGHESSALFLAAWKHFSRGLPARRIEDLDGVSLILTGTQMALLNVAALSSAARDRGDLERRARAAVERAGRSGLPWFFAVPEPWAPGGDLAEAAGVLTRLGFAPAERVTGMATDALAPPRREPAELELRRVSDAETRAAVADLNAGCYGVPLPEGRAAMAHPSIWGEGAFGRVGYLGGQPVCCAATCIVEGVRYAALVATAAEHRRKGYGEAALRGCLDDALGATGIRRTALHASEMGLRLYEAMGYRAITRFAFYVPPQA